MFSAGAGKTKRAYLENYHTEENKKSNQKMRLVGNPVMKMTGPLKCANIEKQNEKLGIPRVYLVAEKSSY